MQEKCSLNRPDDINRKFSILFCKKFEPDSTGKDFNS